MTQDSGHLLSVYKDAGEQSLSKVIATMMSWLVSKTLREEIQAIIYIPDSEKALARRGFDHSLMIAQNLSAIINLPTLSVFRRPISIDQRQLERSSRINNMSRAISADWRKVDLLSTIDSVLLIDDVMTTGSTLLAACDTLREFHSGQIHALTLIRA